MGLGGPLSVWRVVATVLAVALLVPILAAQSAWDDPEGDHEVGFTTESQSNDASYTWTPGSSTGWYPIADLRAASIYEETPDTITFEVQTASDRPSGNEPHPVEYVRFTFFFRHHGLDRSVLLTWYLERDAAKATLRTIADNRSRIDEEFDAVRLENAPGWKVVIPKLLFRDGDRVPLRTGDVLEDVRVVATTGLFSSYSPCIGRPESPPHCWKARDTIAGGAELGDYDVMRSPVGVGHLELTSPTPFRSSNGLATTYIFELTLHNLGPRADAAFIGVGNYPPEWTISSPAYIETAPLSKTVFPIAVSVPFTHLHGNETYIDITATSEQDPVIKANLQIGVVWTKIPQPAGHHPDLYLHADANEEGWMNTLAEDEESVPDAKARWNSYSAVYNDEEEHHRFGYTFGLSPGLESGLDFDRGGNIQVKIPVEFYETVKPTIQGTFSVERRSETIAEIGSATLQANDIAAGSASLYEFTIPVNESADRIPYQEDNNLVFLFEVSYTIPASGGPLDFVTSDQEAHEPPKVLPQDSYIRLPLVEYIDIVDETLLASLTKFSVKSLTETYKVVNPGKIATFAVQIDNRGKSDVLDWKLVGANPEWATVYPEGLSVPEGGNATVVVDVLAPELASEGENFNALLIGQGREDANSQVLVRLAAQVTQSQDVPDETPLSQKFRGIAAKNDAGIPGPTFYALLFGITAAMWLRRR